MRPEFTIQEWRRHQRRQERKINDLRKQGKNIYTEYLKAKIENPNSTLGVIKNG